MDTGLFVLLIFCIVCVCAFEFINGFHDTANAVATVIYTNSLKPVTAVVWSGICNFLGVILGGTAVAMGILKLLPSDMLLEVSVSHNAAMILSLLFAAIAWNLGTWYLGIPCSSSHTLIGSMLGVGLTYTVLHSGNSVDGVNWGQAGKVGLSLLISPALGFIFTLLLVRLLRRVLSKKEALFKEPKKDKAPPWYIRSILILTCTSVSWTHGSNDGQKGIGLLMLILIAIAPLHFALDMDRNPVEIRHEIALMGTLADRANLQHASAEKREKIQETRALMVELNILLAAHDQLDELNAGDLRMVRKNIKVISSNLESSLLKGKLLSHHDKRTLEKTLKDFQGTTDYAPTWVIMLISVSLGLGTMIGWKRIVVTIGEKIGKEHLNYAQGASAEFVAASTIGLASVAGLPVSTTQVLSSGVAGSMVATSGYRNLQATTVKNIFIAWLLTLPVTMALSGGLYYLFLQIL